MDQPGYFLRLGQFRPAADLWRRLEKNFSRLEEEKYQPAHLYQKEKESKGWPGDTEGRTILALVLLAQATKREPLFLDEILARWPKEVNALGYFGEIYPEGLISEQQLASHGWVLRALSEYERWRPGGPASNWAKTIIDNLFLPTIGQHQSYPLDTASRQETGGFSGTNVAMAGPWLLSSDVGCNFICLDGLVDAYAVFGDTRLVLLIEELIARFLQFDLQANHAQTHAALTACRALLRWSEMTGKNHLFNAVVARYYIYRNTAWTETFANFNWFGRPLWTETCAIVDSLMISVELWRRSGDAQYLHDAHLIYFNALGHAQRANGGFGCDNCPGADGETDLFFKVYEAHWCCTMRGGEGLARMVQYCALRSESTLYIIFPLSGRLQGDGWSVHIESSYPQGGEITLDYHSIGSGGIDTIALFVPTWLENASLIGPDSADVHPNQVQGAWLYLQVTAPNESWSVRGNLKNEVQPARNGPYRKRFCGPLLLAQRSNGRVPICDAYKSEQSDEKSSRCRILFDAETI